MIPTECVGLEVAWALAVEYGNHGTGLDPILTAIRRQGLLSEDNRAIYAHSEFYRP